ncbi:DUF4105 domain-containing protein [Fluviispira multicolorata]|uniref:DUF4105 domain-containing protein n=1 Tax=Fluviispira multicolorata TaxID=2654512 RepID=A0A833JEK2_9BACT|nr:DUF4105 domain-containing protein [Fluviispira multicolorata]KAB8033259.1 DUF4105 domain-containing protein [Fluviispira multicolorata]
MFILFSIPFSFFAFSLESDSNNNLKNYFIEKANRLQLAEKSEWRKILFYQLKYFGSRIGMIDGSDFYLSPIGKTDLNAELTATIEHFFSSEESNSSAKCKFPRRLKWLKSHLDDENYKIPMIKCENFENWINLVNPKGVVLVFSSFYINNPSSMFGHTFLRFINSNNPLTDFGVNFAANPDTNNMLSYTYKGLTGMFEGKFSLLPYSVKVQEYNNSESRDLWEYELNLSQEETLNMAMSLWEVGNNRIDYYYFDENCSFILLTLLDTANDQFNFADQFLLWVNPADTLRVVNRFPNLVKNVTFRPSSQKRFRFRYSILNDQEKDFFSKIINDNNQLKELNNYLPKESVAKIFDAVSEYIDFKEKLAGTEESVKYPLFRKNLLEARASLSVISSPLKIEPPKEERPEFGVAGARVGGGYSYSRFAGNALDFELKPVLHSLDSPSAGYAQDAQIELMKLILRYETKGSNFFVNNLDLLNIKSFPSLNPPLYPISWKLRAGLEQDYDCSKYGYLSSCQRSFIEGGSGFSFLRDNFQIYILSQADLAYQEENGFEISLGAYSGFSLRPNHFSVFSSDLEWMKRHSFTYKNDRTRLFWQNSLSYQCFSNIENKIFASFNLENQDWRIGTSIYWYFF